MPKIDSDLLRAPVPGVAVPTYDRSTVTAGIVHFGVGGFHRAHQAMYVDRLMNRGLAREWGIVGVGVMPADRAMADALGPQDGLYTLVVKHPDGRTQPRIVGSLTGFLYAPQAQHLVHDTLTSPTTRIVSLTITEGGYNFNQVTHEFEAASPAVVTDLRGGSAPRTVFGHVVAALEARRRAGIPPFTVMSCDNIQGNGQMARRMFTAFARLRDPGLAAWMDDHVHFPNSMVDRITPVTTATDRRRLHDDFDLDDNWPVVCEPFTQWVLEDDFGSGRPPLQEAGVQLVPDVEPYELMKLRLLNAGHQALAYFGYLLGHRFAHDAALDPRMARFVRDYMDREATPTLPPVPGIDLDAYKDELLERFANPAIADTIARLCQDTSDRIPKWVLPVLRHHLATGGPITHATALIASWARYAEGVDEGGRPIEVVDRLAGRITAAARRYPEDPMALPSLTDLFGDVAAHERFRIAYVDIAARLHRDGAARTLDHLNGVAEVS